jgi:hypothetical protein
VICLLLSILFVSRVLYLFYCARVINMVVKMLLVKSHDCYMHCIYISLIYNSYKAKPHYNIFLQFYEATSSQGPTKSLSIDFIFPFL